MKNSRRSRISRKKRYLRNLPRRLRHISFQESIERMQKYRLRKSYRHDEHQLLPSGEVKFVEKFDEPALDLDYYDWTCLACGVRECSCGTKQDLIFHHVCKLVDDLKIRCRQRFFHETIEADRPKPFSTINSSLPAFKFDLANDFESAAGEIRRCVSEQIAEVQIVVANARTGDPYSNQVDGLVNMLAAYSPFWIREFSTCNGDTIHGLFKHLFVSQRMPSLLFDLLVDAILAKEPEHLGGWELEWLIIIGQGGNLQKAAKYFDWHVNGKFQDCLKEAAFEYGAYGLSLGELCDFAEVLRIGGDLQIFDWLNGNNNLYGGRLSCLRSWPLDQSGVFWTRAIQWLVEHRCPAIEENINLIINWAAHEEMVNRRWPQWRPNKFWQGRTNRSVLDRALRHQQQNPARDQNRAVNHSKMKWSNKGWDYEISCNKTKWKIHELVSTQELRDEGEIMNHCVGTYSNSCVRKINAIFSLVRNGRREGTVQVDLASRQIVQARGRYNSNLSKTAKAFLAHWVAKVVEAT